MYKKGDVVKLANGIVAPEGDNEALVISSYKGLVLLDNPLAGMYCVGVEEIQMA